VIPYRVIVVITNDPPIEKHMTGKAGSICGKN
jgi:hypothetical protein